MHYVSNCRVAHPGLRAWFQDGSFQWCGSRPSSGLGIALRRVRTGNHGPGQAIWNNDFLGGRYARIDSCVQPVRIHVPVPRTVAGGLVLIVERRDGETSLRIMLRLSFLPRNSSFTWKLAYITLSLYHNLFYRITVEGKEHVPLHGPVVLASNHTSGHDIVILGCSSPRQIFFMAKQELFEKNPIVSEFFRRAGVFPVRRGKSDRKAIAHALKLLRDGCMLGMFPEGKRFPALSEGKTGVVRLAMKAQAPIVPVAIIGARDIDHKRRTRRWHRDRVLVRYGVPIQIEDATAHTRDIDDAYSHAQELTTRMMKAIAEMLPPEMRGLYA